MEGEWLVCFEGFVEVAFEGAEEEAEEVGLVLRDVLLNGLLEPLDRWDFLNLDVFAQVLIKLKTIVKNEFCLNLRNLKFSDLLCSLMRRLHFRPGSICIRSRRSRVFLGSCPPGTA